MKKYIFISFLILWLSNHAFANNLVMSTPVYDNSAKTISFTIAWENSWKVTTGPSNWDGVWVFVKRQACSNTNIWATALLSSTSADHTSSAGTNLLTIDAVADGMGVFIRRTAAGIGSIGTHTITLALNSGLTTQPAITASASDNFKVIGTEMVYVPQGGFYLGDGRGTNTSNFSGGNNASTPLFIDGTIQAAGLGSSTNYTSNPIYGCPGNLPATFPLGYNGFWCMKYELSMVAYTEFLNCLTYDQQAARLEKWNGRYPNVNGASFTNASYKGALAVSTAGTYNTVPAVFSNNPTYSSYSPVSYLSWRDLTAYLDWAGLRPMTEFEFEKACRGTANPVANEYPWGNTLITQASGNPSSGQVGEKPNQSGDGLCLYNWDDPNWAPYRSGYAATATSTRSQAASTFYGILDMGGNVFEQVVGGAGYDYSNFTTANGDGILGSNGHANTTGWPTINGANSGNYVKGGSFGNYGATVIQVSDRTYYAGTNINDGTVGNSGGRGVRSY